MRVTIILLIAAAAQAQTTYLWEDHKCHTVTAATRSARGSSASSGGMEVTCSSNHGFDSMVSTMDVKVPAALSNGDAISIDTEVYTFRDSLSGAGDIRRWTTADGITSAEADNRNVAGLVAAIMGADSGVIYTATGTARWIRVTGMSGTYYHASTPASTKVEAYNRYVATSSRAIAGIRSKVPGASGKWTVSKTGTQIKLFSWYQSTEPAWLTISNGGTMETTFYMRIYGASGDASTGWARAGVAASGDYPVSVAKLAMVKDADEIRFPAINSSGFPDDWAATQQANWRLVRHVNDTGGTSAPTFYQTGEVGGSEVHEEGAIRVDVPECASGDSALTCGPSFWSLDNQKAYATYRNLTTTINVSGGVITGTFVGGSAWTNTGGGYTSPAVGVRAQLRGFHKYYETKSVTAVADNGSGIARVTTSAAHNCVNGTDSAYIDWATGPYSDGTFPITVVSSTVVELTGTAYSATATGTLTCNPHGRQANDALRYLSYISPVASANQAAMKITALDSGSITLDATGLGIPDGDYTGTCASTKCVGSAHTVYPYVGITDEASLYMYVKGFNNDSGNSTDTTTFPNSKLWIHAKQSIPLSTPPHAIRIWAKTCGKNLKRPSHGSGNGFHMGNYLSVTARESGGTALAGYDLGHYYDFVQGNQYDCSWRLIEDAAPVGSEGANTFRELPVNINMGEYVFPSDKTPNPSVRELGLNVPYISSLGSAYFAFPYSSVVSNDSSASDAQSKYRGTSQYLGKVEFLVDPGNVFGWIRNRTCTYAPSLYASGGVGTDAAPSGPAGYECGWTSKPDTPSATFELRYSTSATSLRTAGWSTGTASGFSCSDGGDGNATPCGMDTYTGTPNSYAQLTRASQDDHFRLGIRPVLPIQGASANGENTIVQFTLEAESPAFQVGDSVALAGAGIRADGNYTIAEILPRRTFYSYNPETNGATLAFNDAGEISSWVCNGTICTVDFTGAHGLVSGMTIMVSGTNNNTLGGAPGSKFSTSKTYTITVTDSDTITFPSTVNATIGNMGPCPGTPAQSVGTLTTQCTPMKIHVYPGWRLTGTNTGSWTGSGTAKSNEDNRGFAEIYFPKYTAESTPSISLTLPSSVSLTVTAGQSGQVSIPFTSTGGTLDNWSASDNRAYVSLSPASGTAAANVTVTVDASGLTAGSYDATVTFSSTTSGVTNSGATVTVNITVTDDSPIPTLSLNQSTLNFSYGIAGTPPPTQTVTASCTSPGCTVTRSFSGCSWLTVTPSSGATPRAFEFAVDTLGLTEGSYPCTVTMTGTGEVNNSPSNVSVSLDVSPQATGVIVSAQATDTRMLVRMRGNALSSGASCSVEASVSGAVVANASAGGGRGRSVELSGLSPSTLHHVAVNCGVGVGGSTSVTTRASDSGTAVLWPGSPPAGKPKMHIQYGSSDGAWTDYVYDCTGIDCATADEAPAISRAPGRIIYLRRRWLTSEQDANTSTGTVPFGTVRSVF